MNVREYELMNQLEDTHWWYTGLRGFLSAIFLKYNSLLPNKPILLDVGCGTGANIKHFTNFFPGGTFSGFDTNPISLRNSKVKNPKADIYESSIKNPELKHKNYDLITIIDVLYTTGVENSLDGLRKIVNHLKAEGIIIIHNPAYQWLYSEHDKAVHTLERYTHKDMINLCKRIGLRPVLVSYRNFFLFPLLVLHRMPRYFFKRAKIDIPNSDLKSSSKFLNKFFSILMKIENITLRLNISYPWGSSIFVVACKKC